MIIVLPKNALNETQHACRFGDNRLNMAQKGHFSVQYDPKVLNFFDIYKIMTPSVAIKLNGFLIFIKINRLAFCSVQAELSSKAPLLQAGPDHSETCGICNTFMVIQSLRSSA
jgi:hypothetical protein